jgi:hypothetical protein
VAFAALDQLAVIKAALTSYGSGFDTLAVQTARRGMLMPIGATAHLGSQGVVDALPGSIIAPDAEVVVDALPSRIVLGQHAPLGARDENIQDRIDDLAHIQAARPTTGFGSRDQIFDTIPVAVSQIGGVCLCVHTPSVPYPFS